jgi:hypothetical protein
MLLHLGHVLLSVFFPDGMAKNVILFGSDNPVNEVELSGLYITSQDTLKFECGERLEAFQKSLTGFMSLFSSAIVKFLPDVIDTLWEVTCQQIELGDMSLKIPSLNMLRMLIEAQAFPLSAKVY